jgi:hypothetical protein
MTKEQDFPISIEAQFLGGLSDGNPRPTLSMCSPGTEIVYQGELYPKHCLPSASKTYDGDQWLQIELIVIGGAHITHIVNGENVLEYSLPQIGGGMVTNFDPKAKRDGELVSGGYIALQSESHPRTCARSSCSTSRAAWTPRPRTTASTSCTRIQDCTHSVAGPQLNYGNWVRKRILLRHRRSSARSYPLSRSARSRDRVQIIHVRLDRAVQSRELRILRLDQEVLVRRVRALAVTEPEVSRGELQRIAREHVARP